MACEHGLIIEDEGTTLLKGKLLVLEKQLNYIWVKIKGFVTSYGHEKKLSLIIG